jgi:hypothetical protein
VSEAGESGTPHLENDNIVREVVTTTRSGRNVYAPQRLIAQTNFENGLQRLFELSMTKMGMNEVYDVEEMLLSGEMSTTREFGFVGMGIGGGFENTSELHVLTYEEAMRTANHREWSDVVLEEHERMIQHGVFVSVPLDEIPYNAKKITSTWAMRQKADGTKRARLAAHGVKRSF